MHTLHGRTEPVSATGLLPAVRPCCPRSPVIFRRFCSARHFAAILPLLKNFPDHSTLHFGKHGRHLCLLSLPCPPLIPPFRFPPGQVEMISLPPFCKTGKTLIKSGFFAGSDAMLLEIWFYLYPYGRGRVK